MKKKSNPSKTATPNVVGSLKAKEEHVKLRLEIVQIILSLIATLAAAGAWLKSANSERIAAQAMAPSLESQYVEVSPGFMDIKQLCTSPVFGGKLVVPKAFDYLRDPSKSTATIFFDASKPFLAANPDLNVPDDDETAKTTDEDGGENGPELFSLAERTRLVFLRVVNKGLLPAKNVIVTLESYDGDLAGVRLSTHEVRPKMEGKVSGKTIDLPLDDIAPGEGVLIPVCNLVQFAVDEDDWDFAIGPFLHPLSVTSGVVDDLQVFPVRRKRDMPFLIEQGYEIRG